MGEEREERDSYREGRKGWISGELWGKGRSGNEGGEGRRKGCMYYVDLREGRRGWREGMGRKEKEQIVTRNEEKGGL